MLAPRAGDELGARLRAAAAHAAARALRGARDRAARVGPAPGRAGRRADAAAAGQPLLPRRRPAHRQQARRPRPR